MPSRKGRDSSQSCQAECHRQKHFALSADEGTLGSGNAGFLCESNHAGEGQAAQSEPQNRKHQAAQAELHIVIVIDRVPRLRLLAPSLYIPDNLVYPCGSIDF
jgi:hypothetical protein